MIRVVVVTLVAGVLAAAWTPPASAQTNRESREQAAAINAELALAYMREGNLAAARDKIEKALEQNARTAKTQMAAGFIYDRLNDERKASMAGRVAEALGGNVKGKRIGVLGLAFKPNTDDMRDAPSIPLVTSLLEQGASVVAYDPASMERAKPLLAGMECAKSADEVAEAADALVIVTEWDEFRALNLDKIAKRMRGKVLVDLRNVYDRDDAERAGFDYRSIGRPGPAVRAVSAAAE